MTLGTEDGWLLGAIACVWLFIASLYAVLPMIDMPPGTRVWGVSAALFVCLALLVIGVERSTS